MGAPGLDLETWDDSYSIFEHFHICCKLPCPIHFRVFSGNGWDTNKISVYTISENALVNKRCPLRHAQGAARLRRFEHSLRSGQFCPAGRQLCREMGELRLHMNAQLFDGIFQPVIGCNLFLLADLHRLQIGRDDLGKQMGEVFVDFIHG